MSPSPNALSYTPAATFRIVRREARNGSAQLVEIDVLAQEAGLHPDLVRRFIALGLLEPVQETPVAVFPRDAAARLARAARLRRDLGLNYAGAVLACELLQRIETLEQRLARYETGR